MAHHDLKSFKHRFQAFWDRRMTGENRNNVGKNFKVGDTVTLIEGIERGTRYVPTGRILNAVISYIDVFAVSQGYVSLSYSNVGILLIGYNNFKVGDLVEVDCRTGRIEYYNPDTRTASVIMYDSDVLYGIKDSEMLLLRNYPINSSLNKEVIDSIIDS